MNGFLEYVPGTSLLHRMNPVAKLLFAVLFAIMCFCTSNPFFLAAMLVFALALAASCGMMRQTFGLMKAVFVFSLILAILLIFTTPTGDRLVELPWGYIGTGSIMAAVTTILRLEAAAIPLFLTFYVTKISDLSNSVVKVLHVPYKYAFTFASTVHFIPVFMNDMKGIMEAQTARGVEFDQGRMPQRADERIVGMRQEKVVRRVFDHHAHSGPPIYQVQAGAQVGVFLFVIRESPEPERLAAFAADHGCDRVDHFCQALRDAHAGELALHPRPGLDEGQHQSVHLRAEREHLPVVVSDPVPKPRLVQIQQPRTGVIILRRIVIGVVQRVVPDADFGNSLSMRLGSQIPYQRPLGRIP